MKGNRVNFCGELMSSEDFKVEGSNRSFRYGDGLFESMRCEKGKILFYEDHYFRAMGSMCMLRMDIPSNLNMEYLEEEILKTVHENGLENTFCRVRLSFWRKGGGLYKPTDRTVDYLIECEALKSEAFEFVKEGLSSDIYYDHQKAKSDLSTIKSNNGILYVLASVFAEESEVDQVFIQNTDQHLIESQNSNMFLVKDGVVITPDVKSGCLEGIMRKQVLTVLESMQIEVKHDPIRNYEISNADEIWVTNAISGLQFISKYKQKEVKADLFYSVLEKLKEEAFNS